jgi:hypothetical protein
MPADEIQALVVEPLGRPNDADQNWARSAIPNSNAEWPRSADIVHLSGLPPPRLRVGYLLKRITRHLIFNLAAKLFKWHQ